MAGRAAETEAVGPGREFWQRLLATEAPLVRQQAVLNAVELGLVGASDPGTWPGLTPKELERAVKVRTEPLESSNALPHSLRKGAGHVFVMGDSEVLNSPIVAVVGTRGASTYGKAVAAQMAGYLASNGCMVASGGAIGIDSIAHQAAMESGGKTVCVLPCGVDVAYPPRHKELFEKIKQHGCLVSMFACGAPEKDHRLLARNRLLARMSDALLLVEAPENSGALCTAATALEAGVPLFVVPGPVSQPSFKGSHALIRNGGVLCDDPAQVLEVLGISRTVTAVTKHDLPDGPEKSVLEALGGVPKLPEWISVETQLSPSDVLSALTMLEIEGLAVKTPDGYALKP